MCRFGKLKTHAQRVSERRLYRRGIMGRRVLVCAANVGHERPLGRSDAALPDGEL